MAKQRSNKPLLPVLMIGIGLILISAVLVWQLSVNKRFPTSTEPFPTQVQSGFPYPEVTRISLSDAKAAYDTGSAIFVDVRDNVSFNSSHIPGALNLELASLPSHFTELNPAKSIILYCT
jgi:3-mercaptopyruvate sulfurtransferase SseA